MGTLFLDEIGDMSLNLQGKILRLVEQKLQRIGGVKDLQVDVRIITATNKDLLKLKEEGRFRGSFLQNQCCFDKTPSSSREAE